MYFFTKYQSPLGMLTIASDSDHIVGLWMEGQKYFGGTLSGEMEKKDGLFVLKTTKDWTSIFQGKSLPFLSFLYARKAENSGKACGKFCGRFPMER